MVCQACGTQVAEGVPFCSKCGAQVTPAQPVYAAYAQPPMPMYMSRVQRHLQTLGILWCVFGVYRVIGGLIGMFFSACNLDPWLRRRLAFQQPLSSDGRAGIYGVTRSHYCGLHDHGLSFGLNRGI